MKTDPDYPDANGNGVPDAFENIAPLAERLGFDAEESPVKTGKPEPQAFSNPWEVKLKPAMQQNPPQQTMHCTHFESDSPFIICVHVISGERARCFEQGNYITSGIGLAICNREAETLHRPMDLLFTCKSCATGIATQNAQKQPVYKGFKSPLDKG